MRKLSLGLVVLLIVVIVGGTVMLATWDIPSPSKTIVKTLPDDRFPR
jgi:hypothetical protein